MQKSTTALRCTHALPAVVLLLSLQRTRTSVRTPENPPSTDTQRQCHVGRYSFWKQINPQLSQAPRMPHHSLTAHRQHHARKTSTRQIADSNSSRRSNRSQNLVRACFHTAPQRVQHALYVCMCFCVCQLLYLQSSCAPKESPKKATVEREADSTHANYSYHHTHTHAARGMGALNHKTMKNKTKSRSVGRPAHTLSLLP
ncbi:hypothetical protein TcCL_Unassigned00827 [Trypanosoma cruzi]|nr:hypothetical protein TcCL_Unassigned00827 [Trypanosoma cruzi]